MTVIITLGKICSCEEKGAIHVILRQMTHVGVLGRHKDQVDSW